MNDDIMCACFFPPTREQNEENWKNDTRHYFSIDRTRARTRRAVSSRTELAGFSVLSLRSFFLSSDIYIERDR